MSHSSSDGGAEIVRLPGTAIVPPVRARAEGLPCSITTPALPAQQLTALLGRRIEVEIDACDLFQARLHGAAPPVVDARVRRAFFAGRIPGAIHLPADQVNREALAAFADASFVIVYGTDALRLDGVRAAHAMAELGIPVKLLNGGFAAWVAEGFPIERSPAFNDRIASI